MDAYYLQSREDGNGGNPSRLTLKPRTSLCLYGFPRRKNGKTKLAPRSEALNLGR